MIEFISFFFQKPIKIIVIATFLFAIYSLSFKSLLYRLLIVVLFICSLTEIINSILIFNGISIVLSTTIGTILHHITWLMILRTKIYFKQIFYILLSSFIIFTMVNLIFIDGVSHFNNYTFVIGAFIYVIIFIYESFYKLKQESFSYFLSNDYILLFSPVLFFLGLSFYFGFKNSSLGDINIFSSIKLYDFIGYFGNIIYYTLINIYIYREKRLRNAG